MDWLVPVLPRWWMCRRGCAGRQTGCICDRGGGVHFATSLIIAWSEGWCIEYLFVCSGGVKCKPGLAATLLQYCLVHSYLYIHPAQHVHKHMHSNKKVKISFSDFVTHLLCYMLTLTEMWLLLRGFFSIAGIPSVQSNVQVTLSVVTWHKILWCNVLL